MSDQKRKGPLYVDWCPKDVIDGCMLLDALEELAYRRVIDFIYLTNDCLPDDDRKLAAMTKAGNRWKRIKASLVAAGKLQVVDGRLTNEKCQKTLEKVWARSERQSAKSLLGVEARKSSDKLLKTRKTRAAVGSPTGSSTDQPTAHPRVNPRINPNPITHEYPLYPPSGGKGDGDGIGGEGGVPAPYAGHFTATEYRQWLAVCSVSVEGSEALITAPNALVAEWLNGRLAIRLCRCLSVERIVVTIGPAPSSSPDPDGRPATENVVPLPKRRGSKS